MAEVVARIRALLGLPVTPDPERQAVQQRLARQDREIRMAVVDANIEAHLAKERRRTLTPTHPGRRASDV